MPVRSLDWHFDSFDNFTLGITDYYPSIHLISLKINDTSKSVFGKNWK